jgi:opacity protein-like surface antigen
MEGIFMAYLRNLTVAGAAALTLSSTLAIAADMPVPMPVAPVVEDFGGWYLRGDLGMSNQSVKRLDSPDPAFDLVTVHEKGFDSAPTFGVGIGYQFNNWLRADVTTEYRGGATFHGLDSYVDGALPGGFGSNDYRGTKSEWLTLLNGYIDLGTWYSLTPYIGAGIGITQNTISNFRDTNRSGNLLGRCTLARRIM